MKILLQKKDNQIQEQYVDDKQKINLQEDIYVVTKYTENKYLIRNDLLKIGENEDISMKNIKLILNLKTMQLYTDTPIYHNFEEKIGIIDLKYYDNVIIKLSIKIEILANNILKITNYYNTTKINLMNIESLANDYKDFPIYTTSPRYIHEFDEDEIILEAPPEKEKKQTIFELIKKLIPLFISIIIGALMLKLRPRGVRGLIMFFSALVSASLTLITIYFDKKESKSFNQNRNKIYNDYLNEKRQELNKFQEDETKKYEYNDLNSIDILTKINNNSSRLYEREYGEEGFLRIRLGRFTNKPRYKLKNPKDKLKLNYEKLELEQHQVYEDYKENKLAIKTIDLFDNNIGIVGNLDISSKFIHDYILQIIFNQSYHDLNLIFVSKEEEVKEFSIYNKVEHTKNPYSGIFNYCYDESSAETVLNTYLQILRKRDQEKRGTIHIPHLVFIITNYDLIKMHPIMEFLLKDHKDLGFSLLVIDQEINNLPKIISTVVEYITTDQAKLTLDYQKVEDISISLEEVSENKFEIEKAIAKIGQLTHVKGVRSNIPESLGFLEMFEVENPKDLGISERWDNNKSYESLAVLLGKKTKKDEVYLNLHEKAHGPHGLIAGTTGSGKSEVIQTYILSLALNYSPLEVGFLLIDYKGGGMANLFKDMPHHLGSITNLDGYESFRALASIKSELKRRQNIFSQYEVNHINGYHKLMEKDEQLEPMPHLFLISDEFAELKAEQPEFMKELVSAARIGRSLGIHLILATQKPAGVVDEQIWSNSKFKLSLKVAEEADSRELLKTPDAAYITNPGRGYLKVGNNEIYELFQSGYSGGDYIESLNEDLIDKRIYEINELGQKNVLNPEDEVKRDQVEDIQTELDVVLTEIADVYETKNYPIVARPWLPSLGEKIQLNYEIQNLKDYKYNPVATIGLVDLPHMQKQIEFEHNFVNQGHLAIFATPGFGKTTTIQTIAYSLASKNSPELMQFNILDFGNAGLLGLSELNHVSEYIKSEEELRIQKLIKILKKELLKRKKILENKMVNSIEMYNNLGEDKMQVQITIIDNFDGVKDLETNIIDDLIYLSREGLSVGLYFIVTANKAKSIKSNILDLYKSKIVLYSPDKGEITQLLKRSEYEAKEIQGRGQILLEKPEVLQIYYPYKADTDKDKIKEMQEIKNKINENTNGIKNQVIIELEQVIPYKKETSNINNVYLGMGFEENEEFRVELPQTLVIEGKLKSGKTNLLKLLIEQLKENYKIALFDDMLKGLYGYSQDKKINYIEKVNDQIYDSDIFIFNKLDYFELMPVKESKEIAEKFNIEFLKGKIFILEKPSGLKPKSAVTKIFNNPGANIVIENLNNQNVFKIKDKFLLNDTRSTYDYYYGKESQVYKVRPPKVSTEFDNIKFLEEQKMMLGGIEIEDTSYVIAGKNREMFKDNLIKTYEELTIPYTIFDYEDLTKEYNNNVIIEDLGIILAFPLAQRTLILDKLLEIDEKQNVIIVTNVLVKGTHLFLKKYKKPEYAIITDNLGEQRYSSIKDRNLKEAKVGENEGYYVNGKICKYMQI